MAQTSPRATATSSSPERRVAVGRRGTGERRQDEGLRRIGPQGRAEPFLRAATASVWHAWPRGAAGVKW